MCNHFWLVKGLRVRIGREKTCSIFINATRNMSDCTMMDFIGQAVAYLVAIGCSVIQFLFVRYITTHMYSGRESDSDRE